MSTPAALPLPDYNQMAERFDRFLPLIHPVTLALLERLPAPEPGALVLDVACGTGEPGLTLARRRPEVRLLGVDSAAAMIEVARGKAARESLGNARFEVMASEALALADGGADAVISRFGLMMFGDVPASARELARVLRRGGRWSLAVWDEPTRNTLMHALFAVLRRHLPAGPPSPLDRLREWAAEGLRARVLEEAGLTVLGSELFSWPYELERFDDAWDLLSRMGMIRGHGELAPEAEPQVRRELEDALSAYRDASGGYQIPHACRLLFGQR